MEERMAALEQKLDDHILENQQGAARNDEAHGRLEKKLDDALSFQNRLRWVAGTTALILGSIIGYAIHHAALIWSWLPMHGNTH